MILICPGCGHHAEMRVGPTKRVRCSVCGARGAQDQAAKGVDDVSRGSAPALSLHRNPRWSALARPPVALRRHRRRGTPPDRLLHIVGLTGQTISVESFTSITLTKRPAEGGRAAGARAAWRQNGVGHG
jgi:hypothetical protein